MVSDFEKGLCQPRNGSNRIDVGVDYVAYHTLMFHFVKDLIIDEHMSLLMVDNWTVETDCRGS